MGGRWERWLSYVCSLIRETMEYYYRPYIDHHQPLLLQTQCLLYSQSVTNTETSHGNDVGDL